MTEINSVTTLTRDGDIAIITLNSPPVNALSAKVREGLFEGFKAAGASDAKAIVLICEGRTAGHDHNATAADLAQPNEPLLEYRISAHAAADFDDPHLNQTLVRSNTLSCSAAASSATETLGAQTEIHGDRSLLVAVPVSCSKPTQGRFSRAASSRARKAPDPAATIGAAPRAST